MQEMRAGDTVLVDVTGDGHPVACVVTESRYDSESCSGSVSVVPASEAPTQLREEPDLARVLHSHVHQAPASNIYKGDTSIPERPFHVSWFDFSKPRRRY